MTERKTILYLTLFKEMGGGEYAVYNLLKGLDRSRFEPIMMFNGDGPFVEKVKTLGVRVSIQDYPVVMLWQLIYPTVLWKTIRASFRLHSFIRTENVEIVHCTDVLSLLLLIRSSLSGRIRILYNVIFFYEWSRILLFNVLALLFVSRIVTNSRAIRSDLLGRSIGLSKKTVTIYYGIDLERFKPGMSSAQNKLRAELGIPENVKIVAMIARWDRWKGHVTFLDAASALLKKRKDVKFLVVGGLLNAEILTPLKRYYEDVLKYNDELKLGDGLVFLPHRDDIPEVLSSIDVFVCPSEREPIPLIVLEAMAAGAPVVAADSGGIPEQIETGVDGYLFRTGDADSLSRAVERCLDEPTGQLTGSARRKVEEKFELGRYVSEIQELYNLLTWSNGR